MPARPTAAARVAREAQLRGRRSPAGGVANPARSTHVPDRDAVDEQAPVSGDQHCRGRAPSDRAPPATAAPPAPDEREDRRRENQRPDDPVGEDLDRRCRVEQARTPEQPPDDVRTDAAGHPRRSSSDDVVTASSDHRSRNLPGESLTAAADSRRQTCRLATANVPTRDGNGADSRQQTCRLRANVPTRTAKPTRGVRGAGRSGRAGRAGVSGARHDVASSGMPVPWRRSSRGCASSRRPPRRARPGPPRPGRRPEPVASRPGLGHLGIVRDRAGEGTRSRSAAVRASVLQGVEHRQGEHTLAQVRAGVLPELATAT